VNPLRYAVPAARKSWVAIHCHPRDACVAPLGAAKYLRFSSSAKHMLTNPDWPKGSRKASIPTQNPSWCTRTEPRQRRPPYGFAPLPGNAVSAPDSRSSLGGHMQKYLWLKCQPVSRHSAHATLAN
jgi:hypothetical protein